MLVIMQKINFITHFFLKILQRNSKLVILGNLGMPGHTPKMIVAINLREYLTFIYRQKINLILNIFLCQFLNIPSIYHPVKNQKKLMSHPNKNAELTDGETIVIL